MLVIASNITTRDKKVKGIFDEAQAAGWNPELGPALALRELARRCADAGAGAIEVNLQQYHDRPEAMEFAVSAAQRATNLQLCLSTNSERALAAGLAACRQAAIVNYVSIDGARLEGMLPLVARHGAGLVLLVSEPSAPADAREMLKKAAILVGAAGEAGIPGGDILVDPGLVHITHQDGQRHLLEVVEFLRNLPEVAPPEVKSTCWLASASAEAPARLRTVIETALLPMLVGAGLASVFMDVLRPENMRAARLVRIFENEAVYADNDVLLSRSYRQCRA